MMKDNKVTYVLVAIALFISTLFLGCSELVEDKALTANDSLKVFLANGSFTVKADGGVAAVLARVPIKAGVQDVTFSVSAGLFLESNDKTVKQHTDSLTGDFRFARVTLRSDSLKSTTSKDVFVTAEAAGVRDRVRIKYLK